MQLSKLIGMLLLGPAVRVVAVPARSDSPRALEAGQGRSGYNSIPIAPSPEAATGDGVTTDGRSGYNRRDSGRSGHNELPESPKTGDPSGRSGYNKTPRDSGRSGYNSVPATGDSVEEAATSGRSGYNKV